MLVKEGENGSRRVAGLKLRRKWMCKKIMVCAFFVCLQSVIENQLEVRG